MVLPWYRILLISGYCFFLLALAIPNRRALLFAHAVTHDGDGDSSGNPTASSLEEKSCQNPTINTQGNNNENMVEEQSPTRKHVMVLVHGIMGNHKELAYVKQALEREFAAATTSQESFFVYAATSNDHNTLDGIEAGGRRLAEEINDLLKDLSQQPTTTTCILLSILGNSLGGLYARYALPYIDWKPPDQQQEQQESTTDNWNPSVAIIPHIFVTTATPHLGVRDHTYWKVPRSFQPAGAWSMQRSGSDLFRYTDVVRHLCQDEKFLRPLSNFTKRIAYSNAFSTDAAVPTSTAAFLSDSSTSIHYLVMREEELTVASSSEPDLEATHKTLFLHVKSDYPTIRFQTKPSYNSEHTVTSVKKKVMNDTNDTSDDDDVESYAKALDSLGWTKVFVDVRSHIPALWKRGTKRDDLNALVSEQRKEYTSVELKERLSTFDYNTLPFGHSFLVASAKNSIYSWFYSGGRPLVDRIAKELVHEMMAGSSARCGL